MKLHIRITAILLLASLLLGTCGCSSADKEEKELNVVMLDVEVTVNSAIVMIRSEDDVFKESISSDDLEFYVLYFGDTEETRIEDVKAVYKSPKEVGTNFLVTSDVVTVEVKVKESGTLTGKEYVGATQDVIRTNGAGEKEIEEGIEAIKKMLTKDTFSTIMEYGMSGISGLTSAYSVLKILGYVKDPYLDVMQRTLNNVKVIEDSVDSLDKKLDSVYGNLKAELDKINVTTKRTLRNTYAQQWSDFKTQYVDTNNGIRQQIVAFQNRYASNFCAFPANRTGELKIYYDENGAPTVPISENEDPMVSLEGVTIDPAKTVEITLDGNTFAKTKALKVKAIDDAKFISTFDSELRAALLTSPMVTEENVDTVIEDAMTVICAEVMMDTMNEKGKNGTVADDIIDSYVLFCGKLCDTSANPVEAYHYLITSGYNFQSEAKNDIEAFNAYILALAAEGRTYCDFATHFGSVKQSKKATVETSATDVASFIESHSGLREEKAGKQYCYVTDSYVTAAQYTANLYEEIICHLSVMVFFTTGVFDDHSFRIGWNEKPTGVISTTDLQEIYATYRAMLASGTTRITNFEDYFLSALVLNSENRPKFQNLNAKGLISGSKFDARAFSLDGTTSLKAYSDVFSARTVKDAGIHAACDFFETGETYAIGKEFEDSGADKGCFAEHSAVFSDVMDIKTETFYDDRQLISGAMFIDSRKSYIVDELWEFAGVADLSDRDNWSGVVCTYKGDPAFDPQHPFGGTHIMDYMINSNTHNADSLYYYLSASAVFWAIVNA